MDPVDSWVSEKRVHYTTVYLVQVLSTHFQVYVIYDSDNSVLVC